MRYFLLSFLTLISAIGLARDPLPAKSVFKPEVTQIHLGDHYQTSLTIDFPDGYYLYADKTKLNDGEFSEQRTPAKEKNDPYLGKVNVWEKPPTITITHPEPLETLTLKSQGCEADVICYPPTTWQLSVPPAAVESSPAPAPKANKIFPAPVVQKSPFLGRSATTDILDAKDAFPLDVQTDADGNIVLFLPIPEGYYVYRDSIKIHYNGTPRDDFSLPQGEAHHDEFFGDQAIFRGELNIILPFHNEKADGENQLQVNWQGCAEGRVCYPPMSETFSLTQVKNAPEDAPKDTSKNGEKGADVQEIATISPPAPAAEKTITDHLNEHFFLALPLLLLLGIGVSFTACIYPLVPIVTSLVVGKNTSTGRAYGLIGAYVFAMGAAMAFLGAIFGIFEINLQLVFQKPWIAVLAALIFVGLSLSLFDVYTLQMPRWLQKPVDKLGRKQQSGSFTGAAAMGALSVLVVSPCATPILTALLLFTTQTTPLKGALALFFFGLGTGLPLFLFAGAFRQFMPKAGSWMDNVKKVFAFALLGVAAYLITRIMPLSFALGVWALFALFFAVYWFKADGSKARLFFSGVGLLLALALAAQSVAFYFGGAAGSSTSASFLPAGEKVQTGVNFRTTETLGEIEKVLESSNQPVILDFYADWCVSCKKWEREIWHNPQFFAPLADYTLLKVDVTDFNAQHKLILQKLGLVGPPAVLIYPPHGQLTAPSAKIIGELSPAEFAAILTDLPRK